MLYSCMLDKTRDLIQKKMNPSSQDGSFPQSFYEIYEKLEKWIDRFPNHQDSGIFNDLALLYLSAAKSYTEHRSPVHLFRLVAAIHVMQKKLFRKTTQPNDQQVEIKWIPTNLLFPFASKPVLGCLVGVNLMDRYELFDEENILLILQKHFPDLKLVKESSYLHPPQKKNHKLLYFEIEKSDGTIFSLKEQLLLKEILEEKIKNSIQRLTPAIFMRRNEEEVCKNILMLSQEITSIDDRPQAVISLEQQTVEEIIFLVTLVYIAPCPGVSLTEPVFITERQVPVKTFGDRLIEAHIFRIHLQRSPILLRSDGSLDFYLARQKAVALIRSAIGSFRDYNGGILIKLQEHLQLFKEDFADVDQELLETFFYSITPLEKQVSLPQKILKKLFFNFLDIRKERQVGKYLFRESREEDKGYLTVKSNNKALKEVILEFLKNHSNSQHEATFSMIHLADEFFFGCVIKDSPTLDIETFIELFKAKLALWEQRIINQKILRISFEYSFLSLDPRIGGESFCQIMAGLLFEGLTRYDKDGCIELAIAETIEISSDGLEYKFKLQPSCWNDQSPLTAYDFEYAWKKVLSPDFKTSFAYLFYPIRGAKEAKEGKISTDEVGIHVIDELTLKVVLSHPAPYFLELTSHQIYSPIHRLIDQEYPQWPYQSGKNFPCNGAFLIAENHADIAYKLVKNPLYWDSEGIDLDEIIFNGMNSFQALQAFRRGEVDWLGHPLGSWMTSYEPMNDDQVISFPNGSVCWHVFNTSKEPFNNTKLRQAIAYSIERASFCDTAAIKITPALSALLPKHINNPEARFPNANHEAARKLWAEGWKELGMELSQIPRLSLIYHSKGVRDHIVSHIHTQLSEVLGIDCELVALSWNVLFHRMTKGEFQMGIMSWHSWINDPVYTLNGFRFAKEDTNFSKWENPAYQELLDKSDQEMDLEKRKLYFSEAEEILCREMPIIPLFYQQFMAMVKKNLSVTYNVSRAVFNFARCFYKK